MMQFLKANTEVKVRIGPFVDVGDGFTPETGITLAAADEAELLKHNGVVTVDISGGTMTAVANCDGWYDLTMTAAYTDTEGLLDVIIQDDSACLPVHARFMVLSQAAYDSMFTAKDAGYMDINVKAISEDTTAADTLELFVEAVDQATGQLDAGSFAADALAAATFATGCLTADAFAADALAAATFATGCLTADAFAADALVAATFATGCFTADAFAADALVAATFATGCFTADAFAANALVAATFAADYLTAINGEVADVLTVDTITLPGQAAPSNTPTLESAIAYLYKGWRNKIVIDSSTAELYDDAGTTVDQKWTVADDGTDFTKGEVATGP